MAHLTDIQDAYYSIGAVLVEVTAGIGKLDKTQINSLKRAEVVLGKLMNNSPPKE